MCVFGDIWGTKCQLSDALGVLGPGQDTREDDVTYSMPSSVLCCYFMEHHPHTAHRRPAYSAALQTPDVRVISVSDGGAFKQSLANLLMNVLCFSIRKSNSKELLN